MIFLGVMKWVREHEEAGDEEGKLNVERRANLHLKGGISHNPKQAGYVSNVESDTC